MGNQSKQKYVGLIDVYTFATQVMANAVGDTDWNNGPTVTTLSTGRIISANDKAKELGINNTLRLRKALKIYPKLKTFQQPNYPINNKPDQTLFRAAGHAVFSVIDTMTKKWEYPPTLHWVPQDETYLDLTDQVNYHFQNNIPVKAYTGQIHYAFYAMRVIPEGLLPWPLHENTESPVKFYQPKSEYEEKMAIASKLCSNLQRAIHKNTEFHVSAGVAPNKMLAKIACGLNPPGSLSALSKNGINNRDNSDKVALKKLSPLNYIVKQTLASWNVTTVGQLQQIPFRILAKHFGQDEAIHIRKVAKGEDFCPVVKWKFLNNVNCSKSFLYVPILTFKQLRIQINCLKEELSVRMQEQFDWYGRRPTYIQLVLNFVGWTIIIPLDMTLWGIEIYMTHILREYIKSLLNAKGDQLIVNVKGAKISAMKFVNQSY